MNDVDINVIKKTTVASDRAVSRSLNGVCVWEGGGGRR